jgi:DNA-directed RNA polymerase specialized sigma24 family protein/tetratricopeptide (TPR) repeat protein
MFENRKENRTEIEWMVQSSQVEDNSLVEALFVNYYAAVYQMAAFIQSEPELASVAACKAILKAAANRHRYIGEFRLKAWILRQVMLTGKSISIGKRRNSDGRSNGETESHPDVQNKRTFPDSIEKENSWFNRLEEKQKLALILNYVHGLSLGEIAYVLNTNKERISNLLAKAHRSIFSSADFLDRVHFDSLLASQADLVHHLNETQIYPHNHIRRLLIAAAGDNMEPGEKVEVEQHFFECDSCKTFAGVLSCVERWLLNRLQNEFPLITLSDDQLQNSIRQAKNLTSNGSTLRKFLIPARMKEISFGVGIVLVVVLLGWYSRLVQPEPEPVEILLETVIIQITATPYPQIQESPLPAGKLEARQAQSRAVSDKHTSLVLDLARFVVKDGYISSQIKATNTGPGQMALVLNYWGSPPSPNTLVEYLRYHPLDSHAIPQELMDFAEQETALNAIYRMGGDIHLLKKLLAEDVPVIVQNGFEHPYRKNWEGRYEVVIGYDEVRQEIYLLDQSNGYKGSLVIPYDRFMENWRPFNFGYLVIYPSFRKDKVEGALAYHLDEVKNLTYSAQKAISEIYRLEGRDLFFALFNWGTSLTLLGELEAAGAVFDQAYSIYHRLSETEQPQRMLWYQDTPYRAYFHTSRYQKVIELASMTLAQTNAPLLVDSYFWRGMAREAMGDLQGAALDFQMSLQSYPNFDLSTRQQDRLNDES